TVALQAWTMTHIGGFDAAILSVDQLLHGGLLASRQAKKTPDDESALLEFLRALHAAHPTVPLYAFSILPRMTPPDGLCDWEEQKKLMRYSRLVGKVSREKRPAAGDIAELDALRADISPDILSRYEALFTNYADFGERLIRLAEDGVLARLVIGQDDSEPNSIPNLVFRQLSETLAKKQIGEDHVFLAQGADEIALSILAADEAKRAGVTPRIALKYGDDSTPARVLPYMGATMEATALEKIRMARGVPVAPDAGADFILYLAANDETMQTPRENAAKEVGELLRDNRAVALVDLSEHLRTDEILLPLLIEKEAPIQALTSYAGWNTASNAVGTAVAHAVLLQIAERRAKTEDDAMRVAAAHLSFLDGRFLEDCFYLKDVVDHINSSLEKCGAQNGRGLEYNYNYPVGSFLLETALENRRARLADSAAFRVSIEFPAPEGKLRLRVAGLSASARYPWPRTFEIDLITKVQLEKLSSDGKS
ncbi:MAG: DUF4127 family protein, partial [Schwartzia sp.]|nr:DUF4127 family protein [Schwartzia sp. (in: firmicutes)]